MKKALARLRPSLSLSALATPLAGADEFYIVLDEPHRVWAPGDVLAGAVVLDLPKPVRTTQVRLRLLGQLTVRNPLVKGPSFRHALCHEEIVLWDGLDNEEIDETDNGNLSSREFSTTPSSPTSSTATPPTTTSTTTSTSTTQPAVSAGILARGEHTFAFMLELPAKGLMTSLEFEKGSIVYMLTASHHRPGPFPPATAHKVVPLQCRLDISDLPPPKPSMLSVEIKKKSRSRGESGTATAVVETPSVGCLRGDSIPVKITVRHVREVRSVTGVVITFLRISRVCAQDLEPLSFRKDISQSVVPLYIDSRSLTTTITTNIRVPTDIFPTIDEYPLVAFKYCLEVVLDLSGKADLPIASHALACEASTPSDVGSRPYVDTELLKRVKGVVSLWTEIVIGTERSEQIPSHRSLKNRSSNNPSAMPSPANSPAPDRQPVTFAAATAPAAVAADGALYGVPEYADRQPDNTATYQPSEKERVMLLEQALLPSAPPGSVPSTEPDAPPLDILEPSEAAASDTSTPADKLEQERARLLQLASVPVSKPADSELDNAPVYSASAPMHSQVEAYLDADGAPSSCASRSVSEVVHNGDSDNDNESTSGDWVPVYSPNAEEEYVSMGGYHHSVIGYRYDNGYDLPGNTNVPYEYVVHTEDEPAAAASASDALNM
ncbi:uncharacterized protein V2V93DRAFT_375205 [Kockiozyma suomiensis]|uniref:uncharacterized protein n=1 Tax=Kockiozyma suomiensis TaxID=1337062 RepID=UPI0033431694